MKTIIKILVLPFKWIAYLFLQSLLKGFDNYNEDFKKWGGI